MQIVVAKRIIIEKLRYHQKCPISRSQHLCQNRILTPTDAPNDLYRKLENKLKLNSKENSFSTTNTKHDDSITSTTYREKVDKKL